ncbi:hypothetical protein KUTeg_021777 [Tegillarca granosa]|uniref:EGF-like domain-containing protein n=1 Tax=Tegillarca granosa TaxID=220873 RepID=A0ABQ9E4C4_TEGGR|nr:hypothetical protein KUTeg_021777 [Tegillarca granosa]
MAPASTTQEVTPVNVHLVTKVINVNSCEDGVNTYTCNCLTGFEGRNCGVNIDDCASRPCKNGATCNDQINDFNCTCLPGWTGPTCEVNINECFPNPCLNGAMCSDFVNYYNCSCVAGYTGKNCETDINDCANNPCHNNGTCQDKVNGYECICPTGQWMGKTCSEIYNACYFTPCQNGATCATNPPSLDYNCTCPLGFDGNTCQNNINDCIGVTCTPPLVCHDGINNYTCACETGANCELMTSYCDSAEEVKVDPPACKNGGTCTGGANAFTCSCAPGFTGITGANCEINIDECEPGPCQHGGQCQDLINGYECNCTDTGFNGTNCELNIDDCAPRPCQHGSNCTDLIKVMIVRLTLMIVSMINVNMDLPVWMVSLSTNVTVLLDTAALIVKSKLMNV